MIPLALAAAQLPDVLSQEAWDIALDFTNTSAEQAEGGQVLEWL